MPFRLAIAQEGGWWDSNPRPSEPQSDALTNCAKPTVYPPHAAILGLCVREAGDGNRTHVSSLEGWCSTIELRPRSKKRKMHYSINDPPCQSVF